MIKKSLGLKNCKQLVLRNNNLEQLVEQLSFYFDKYLNFNLKFNKHYKVKQRIRKYFYDLIYFAYSTKMS